MRRFSDRHSMHTLNELNVTPLLDLVFVLLLIFMITTPLMENSTDLVLPTGKQDGREVDSSSVINVSLYKDGRLFLNTDVITLDQLAGRLEAMKVAKPEMAVLVRPHKELPIQRLIEVMDTVKAAKVTKVGLAKSTEGQ